MSERKEKRGPFLEQDKQTQLRRIKCEMTKGRGAGGGGEMRGRLKPERKSSRRRGEGIHLVHGAFVLGYEMIR